MRKIKLFFSVAFLIVALFITFYERPTATGKVVEETAPETKVFFCPRDDCARVLTVLANASSKIECAIYDIKSPAFLSVLESKGGKLVTDKDYAKNLQGYQIDYRTNKYYLMHNKFCVFDDSTITTGSFNVVENDDRNNLVVVHSKALARNYAGEFAELWALAKDERTQDSKVVLNGAEYESYFCPEDWCGNKIIEAIKLAKDNITFMTYSFTHDGIADEIVKKKQSGLLVRGIFDAGQNSNEGSEFEKFKSAGIDVILDTEKARMHNKVFVIDDAVVITGSMNPTGNGDTANDENILIIHDSRIARLYVEEAEKLRIKK